MLREKADEKEGQNMKNEKRKEIVKLGEKKNVPRKQEERM